MDHTKFIVFMDPDVEMVIDAIEADSDVNDAPDNLPFRLDQGVVSTPAATQYSRGLDDVCRALRVMGFPDPGDGSFKRRVSQAILASATADNLMS